MKARNHIMASEDQSVVLFDLATEKLPNAILIIDADDFDFARRYRWTPWQATNGVIYATAERGHKAKRERVLLHRQIMRARFDEVVDHINGNGLDDRKANLRLCADNWLNLGNRHTRKSKTGFLGVRKLAHGGRCYQAQMMIKTKLHYLGCFATAEEAARARDAFAIEHYGEFASLNFPEAR